jgi:predicted kinase
MRYLAGRSPLFEHRIAEGRICDGHGDLLASDVFLLDDGPRLLDCIEFDPRLRHVDVIADVAFLVMDLERLGAGDLAAYLLEQYQVAAGTRFTPSLVDHYCAERAAVRAEVACLRAAQTGDDESGRTEAGALADLALAHLEAGRVVLGVISGLPGTGKSSLAAALAARLGWPVLNSDEIRRELVAPGWRGPLRAASLPGAYRPEVSERTYATMLARARSALGLGQSVLLDATFTAERWRRGVEQLASDTASDLVVLSCEVPAELAARRMRSRLSEGSDVSGADESVARSLAAGATRWPRAVVLDTRRPVDEVVLDTLPALRGGQGRSSVAKRRAVMARPAVPITAR